MKNKQPSTANWRELILYCSAATLVTAVNVGISMLVLF